MCALGEKSQQYTTKDEVVMFAKFKMEITKDEFNNQYRENGNELRNTARRRLEANLEKYLLEDGSLDASQVEANWFPSTPSHVFISHSHADEQKALNLAGFLQKEHGVSSFIDSTIWGYSNDLLKKYDDIYSIGETDSTGKILTYNYEKRNQSTAHIHLLLQGALAKMIDRCQCLIFINTPNSIKFSDTSISQTASPWIYNELLMANLLNPKRSLSSILEAIQYVSGDFSYPVNLASFVELTYEDLRHVDLLSSSHDNPQQFLNRLYHYKELI